MGDPASTADDLYGVSAVDKDHVWAVGDLGIILYYDGSGWEKQHDGSTHLNGITARSGNVAWAVGDEVMVRGYTSDSNKVSPSSPWMGWTSPHIPSGPGRR
ncbi:MAG: hypothetical protein SWK76_03545 [Actinomycetota bacterium]|nr:hypothetical protein [Actinomycetota bacterium]